MSLHLPIATLAALALASGDRVVGPYDGPLMAINQARLANSSLSRILAKIAKENRNAGRNEF
jgi:hypothetical protein